MRRAAIVLLLLAGACNAQSAPAPPSAPTPLATTSTQPAPPPAPAPEQPKEAEATPPEPSADDRVRDLVRRWNEAHATRDASLLEPLYADTFSHYGAKISRAQGVKAKATAFAAAPDFTQSIGKVDVEETYQKNKRARFTKTVTQAGKTKDYPALLVFSNDRIIEENDDVDWCRNDMGGPSDHVVPPFTMSAYVAMGAANNSKHIAAEQKRYPGVIIDHQHLSCAKVCAKPDFKCGYATRTLDLNSKSMSRWHEYLYIDPVEKKLWFEEGGVWKSEPLPAWP